MGNGHTATAAKQNGFATAAAELEPGLAAAWGPGGGGRAMGFGEGPVAKDSRQAHAGQDGWWGEATPEDAVQLARVEWESQPPVPSNAQTLARHPHQQNQIWPEVFLSCSTCDHNENGTGHNRMKIGERQNTGQGCRGLVTAGKGERGHASELSRY